MGSTESKVKLETNHSLDSSNVPTTPNGELIIKNLSEFDPRSPTENVSRTPIKVASLNRVPLKEKCNTIYSDPRSPTNQFSRTPIVIYEKHSTEVPLKFHNKLLDNAKRSIVYHQTRITENSIASSPKFLKSNSLSNAYMSKNKTPIGILETNIDYTETNIDDYMIKNKSVNSSLSISICENDLASGSIFHQENCDPRSPSKDILRTPMQILKKVGEIDLNDTKDDFNGIVPEINEIDSVVTTESLLKVVDVTEHEESKMFEKITSNNSVIFTDEDQINTDSLELEDGMKYEPIDLTEDIRELDKKLTEIIHKEEQYFPSKVLKKVEGKTKVRTPMKDRNTITEPVRRNELRVSDKPRKSERGSEYAISKIPVYQKKRGKKVRSQCENTPPRHKDIKRQEKTTKPKWDSDKTLVI